MTFGWLRACAIPDATSLMSRVGWQKPRRCQADLLGSGPLPNPLLLVDSRPRNSLQLCLQVVSSEPDSVAMKCFKGQSTGDPPHQAWGSQRAFLLWDVDVDYLGNEGTPGFCKCLSSWTRGTVSNRRVLDISGALMSECSWVDQGTAFKAAKAWLCLLIHLLPGRTEWPVQPCWNAGGWGKW